MLHHPSWSGSASGWEEFPAAWELPSQPGPSVMMVATEDITEACARDSFPHEPLSRSA
jgi:hypothetical protein